jgi:hypothetical protein
VRYGFLGADVFATSTKDHTFVRVDSGFLFAIGCFGFEGLSVTEFDAFSACGTFVVVYFWVPWDLASRYSFVFGFGHGITVSTNSS